MRGFNDLYSLARSGVAVARDDQTVASPQRGFDRLGHPRARLSCADDDQPTVWTVGKMRRHHLHGVCDGDGTVEKGAQEAVGVAGRIKHRLTPMLRNR